MRRLALLAVIGLAAVVCVACQLGAGGLSEQDKATIRQMDDDWIKLVLSEKPDLDAKIPGYYAEDVKVMIPNMPMLEGHAGIKAAFAQMPPAKEFKLTEVSLEGAGDLAYRHYTYVATMVMAGMSEPITDRGKGIEIFKKQADGTWRVIRDVGNSDLPPPGLMIPTGTMAADASPEVKKLADIVGRWQMDGTFRLDPKSAAGPVVMTLTCDWFSGGRQVFCRFSGTLAGAAFEEVFPYLYDPRGKAYTYHSIVSDGTGSAGKLAIQPGTWIHTADTQIDQKPARSRFTYSNMSAVGGAWKYEVSVAGGAWTVIGEGTYKKGN